MLHPLTRLATCIVCVLVVWSGATAHAAVPNIFARVAATGDLIAGSQVTRVDKLGVGMYEVRFVPVVSGCAYLATTTNIYTQALTAHTAGGHLDAAYGVYVETKNQGGGLTDGQFDLAVICGVNGTRFAVVGYSSNLVRSTLGVVLTWLGPGQYNVTFPVNVSKCAYVATVGDPGTGVVFNPGGVYTASGPNVYTVYVETKNPGGGLQDAYPFHLAVICSTSARSYISVVGDSGLPSRGSTLTSSHRWNTGRYVVATKAVVEPACATVATRGSTGKTVPFTPTTVELEAAPAGNTKGIQVRDLLFFGGGFANQAFHAAIICK